jgi:glycosyltransferase involved in cell wall biosynthesis
MTKTTDSEINAQTEEKPVLLYFYQDASSFVNQDNKFFREYYTVKEFTFKASHKLYLPFIFFLQKLFLLANIRKASVLVCQFAGYHSFLPVIFAKIFHKPCLIVVGGTDCVSFPSINYGNLRKPLLRWFTLKSLKFATHIASPSEALAECDYTYTGNDYSKQGFRFFDRSIKTAVTVIFNGIDTSHFKMVAGLKRKRTFLTVCNIIDRRNFRLKGIDLFIEMAVRNPDCEFTIIGRVVPGFGISTPANVTMVDYVPHEMLPEKMAEFSFYCQLSLSEGFGVALAEAMACGCVPIVSKVGILDFITGDSGFVLKKYSAEQLMGIIGKALESDIDFRAQKARARVVELFDSKIRRSALLKLLKELRR